MWHSLKIQTEVGYINPDNMDAHKDDVMGVAILRNLNQSGYPHGDSSIFWMVVGPKVHWSENPALVRMVNSPTGR